ncbi:Protein CBG00862 [Caenorhabditis briggsae]|uniref:Protein CBG00862 n=1 Tax=Caenorhabditis briggsae TaxID=6238 RepID=A8WPF8_CAEBR|nr:Protein CBG00862 [Caenorhabditis briggsae]CAP22365.2 Protein CBG00862 [Caenorhabditis briggsae]
MRNENRWMYLPKSAQAKAPVKTPLPDDTTPIPTPQIPQIPQKAQAPLPLAQAPPPPPPPHLGSYYDLPPNITAPPKLKPSPLKNQDMGGNSPIIPLDPTDVSSEVTKKDALAPPTSSVPTSSGVSSGTLTSSGTTPTTYTTPPETTPSGNSDSSFTTPLTTSSNARHREKASNRMFNTVRMIFSNRRSRTGSWLFDSTGSNRFDSSGPPSGPSAKTNSTVSSSILKTDSSYYKTASVEQFPHGAFTFQSN